MSSNKWAHAPDQLAPFRQGGYELVPLNAVESRDKNGRLIGKAPMGSKWRLLPPLSVEEASAHMETGCNVGVRLRPQDLVIDADPRNYAPGDDPLARLEHDLGIDLEGYPTVTTGSGGKHIYMLKPPEALLRDSLEAYQGVEFKAHGRQVVAPGSVHPGQLGKDGTWLLKPGSLYYWDEDVLSTPLSGVSDAPDALIELTRRPGRTAAVDAGNHTTEALELMLDGLDPCQYSGDHNRWLEIMMACHHATAGEGREEFIAWSTGDPKYAADGWIIGRRWDSLSADHEGRRVTEKTLFKALVDQGRADLLPKGDAANDFEDVSEEVQPGTDGDEDLTLHSDDATGDPMICALERMNAKGYCAVNENGKFRIYRPRMDWGMVSRETPTPRTYWETGGKSDFLDYLANVRVQKGMTTTSLASEWLKWGRRTSYDGVAFDPGNRIPREAKVLNLWTDWAVEPKEGDWSLLRQLLLEGLCDGNEEMFEYVLNWSAFMVQHPDQQAEVALVFKGQKGTGKGTFLRALYKLAGRHGMHISSQQHFTNHFNAHLRDCILLFADEAMWAGDKRAEGTLKALITEPTIVIEAKGKDVVTARNYLHVVMASNEDWVIPASMDDERRFAVTEVNTKFRGNKAFFAALHEQLDRGGLQGLLFDLKRRKLAGFHPRARIPMTAALAKQKLQSLDNADAWWYESLCRGSIGDADPIMGTWETKTGTGSCVFLTEDLQRGLEEYLRKLGDRHLARRSMQTLIGDRLKKRLGSLTTHVRIPVPPERMDAKSDSTGRAYGYSLPSLQECRARFETQLGAKLPWTSDAVEIDPILDVVEL